MSTLTDKEALDAIHMCIDGTDWDTETAGEIAQIVEMTGRVVHESTPYHRTELKELLIEDYINALSGTNGVKFVTEIFNQGHKGFDQMTYAELHKACLDANLIDEDEED